MEGTIEIADTVLHRPSGEQWIVARVDGPHLWAAGWPCTRDRLADCELVEKASADWRADVLRQLQRLPASDPRAVPLAPPGGGDGVGGQGQ